MEGKKKAHLWPETLMSTTVKTGLNSDELDGAPKTRKVWL